jgi:hypothetical protein
MARSAENSLGGALAESGLGGFIAQSASPASTMMKVHARKDKMTEPAADLGSNGELPGRVLIGTV